MLIIALSSTVVFVVHGTNCGRGRNIARVSLVKCDIPLPYGGEKNRAMVARCGGKEGNFLRNLAPYSHHDHLIDCFNETWASVIFGMPLI